jgi:hypothetical protein
MENTVLSYCRGVLPLSCLVNSLGPDHIENTSSDVLLCCLATGRYVTILIKKIKLFAKSSEPLFCLPPAFTLASHLAYSLSMKMETTCSSKTCVDFQRTTLRYIPEDGTLDNHRCENLKSYKSNRSS